MVPMFLQRYVHVVLDAVLGSYVKNIDPDALQISVWNGQLEIAAVELQPDALPLPPELRLVKGVLRRLRIDMPWTNLASEPIRVEVEDVSVLLQVRDAKADASPSPSTSALSDDEKRTKTRETLRRKRATMDAIEKATQFNERNVQPRAQGGPQSWMHSFVFKLLVKALDNVQLHVQHCHLRLEDSVSAPARPFAVGVTLEALIIKSADAGWNYTMVVRGGAPADGDGAGATILRKKMEVNKLGVYWSLPLAPVPLAALNDAIAFTELMQRDVRSPSEPLAGSGSSSSPLSPPSLFRPRDFIIHPLTVSMKLTVNDGHAKLPLTHQELSDRVLSRLGTPWMVETIDAIGDAPWREFLAAMPRLAGERKYTLGFVFSEAWSVARELSDDEDDAIPSVEQFKVALASCLQWSAHDVERLAPCIATYRDAVVHVMDEKSTYIDANAAVDQVRLAITREQYLSALSLASFVTVKRRQARYVRIRPARVRVAENPALWWKYAISAVLLDVRERLARVDWAALRREKEQRKRYMELYQLLAHNAVALVSADVKRLPKDAALAALDELECAMDVKDLLRLRRAARKEIEEHEQAKKQQQSKIEQRRRQSGTGDAATASTATATATAIATATAPPTASASLWSYASWLTGATATAASGAAAAGLVDAAAPGSLSAVDDVRWSEQDTKDLYDAINFHPTDAGASDDASKTTSHTPQPTQKSDALQASAAAAARSQDQQHIWYRFQLGLTQASFGLYKDASDSGPPDATASPPLFDEEASGVWTPRPVATCLLLASLDNVDVQFLVRPSSLEMGLQVRDAFFCQDDGRVLSPRDFFLQRMAMAEVLRYHPVGAREKITSVRLRACEKELPLLKLSIESRRDAVGDDSDDDSDAQCERGASVASGGKPTFSRFLRVSLVTQPIMCNVNLMYLLDVSAFFSRPLHVDLSGLEQSAWKRAQSLQRYSAAQLREALARRTRVEMQLDVISPLINVVEVHSEAVAEPNRVSLLVFLGHLRASTIHPSTDPLPPSPLKPNDAESNAVALVERPFVASPATHNLYDIIEFSISGIEVQLFESGGAERGSDTPPLAFVARDASSSASSSLSSSWNYLLEKTSLSFSFHMSVAPDDPTLPLLKLFGGVDSVHLNLSAATFRSVLSLLQSFGENFTTYSKRKLPRPGAAARRGASAAAGAGRLGGSPPTLATYGSDPTSGAHALAPAREIPVRLVKSSSYFMSAPLRQADNGGAKGKPVVSDSNVYASFAKARDQERDRARRKEIEDKDLLKLWKRVLCQLQFGVGEIVLKLQIRDQASDSEKLVVVRAVDINTRLKLRTFDRRLEFALGTFAVEDILRSSSGDSDSATVDASPVVERKRYLMTSGSADMHPDVGYTEQQQRCAASAPPPPPPRSSEQLIRVAITSIASDAELPKDTLLWRSIAYDPVLVASSDHSVWQEPLVTPLSIDASLRTLTINLYQDTVAEMFVFFFERDDGGGVGAAPGDDDGAVGADASHAMLMPIPSVGFNDGAASGFDPDELAPMLSPAGEDPNGGTLTKKFGAWVATSFLESLPGSSPEQPPATAPLASPESAAAAETELNGSPARIQLRLHVDGLSLFLHLEERQRRDGGPSAFMSLTAEKFCCCVHKYPLYLGIFSYLTSLKICDVSLSEKHFREIISHAPTRGRSLDDRDSRRRRSAHQNTSSSSSSSSSDSTAPGHIPTLDETLRALDDVPAVFSCAAQLYGADQIQESWHPGYSNRFSVRLKSPRIRFLYSFVDDLRRYWFEGELLETVFKVLFRERVAMVWEGDFEGATLSSSGGGGGLASSLHGESPARETNNRFLGSDVVSMFPLLDVQLTDAVLEMPPHRMSSEALVVRFDTFRMSNEHVLESVREMENRIVAKVLLNASLTQLTLDLTALRIVSVLLIEPSDDSSSSSTSSGGTGGGFVTQSLLGSTNSRVTVDFRTRAAVKIDLKLSPVRLVCNQKQYAFVLRVPFQNIRERSRYYAAASSRSTASGRRASSGAATASSNKRLGSVIAGGGGADASHQSVIYEEAYSDTDDDDNDDDDDERHVVLSVAIPEISMEMLQGHDGYHPSVRGDLYMADKDKTKNKGSICVLDVTAYYGRADYCVTTGQLVLDAEVDGIHVRDSRMHANLSAPYRDVVVFERGRDGGGGGRAKSVALHFVRATEVVEVDSIGIDASFLSSSMRSSHSASAKQPLPRPPPPHASDAASPSDVYRKARARTRSPIRRFNSRALFKFASPAKPLRRHNESINSVFSHRSRSSTHTSQPSGDNLSLDPSSGDVVGTETRMDLILDVVGFRVIPSNIYCDVLRFLEVSQSWGPAESADAYEPARASGAPGNDDNDDGAVGGVPGVASSATKAVAEEAAALAYRKIGLRLNLGPSALLLVEDPTKDKSRALMLSWEAAISLEFLRQVGEHERPSDTPSQSHNQLQLRTNITNIHATSRIPDDSIWAGANVFNAATADCLKPIDLELVLHVDLVSQFLRFRTKFDRVMELRFGYLDFCTAVAALENILRRPRSDATGGEGPDAKPPRKRTSSGSSSSLLSGGNGDGDAEFGERSVSTSSLRGLSLRSQSSGSLSSVGAGPLKPSGNDHRASPTLYGKTLVHLVSTSVRGRLQSRPVVGFYNSPWRKRYLVLPYTSQERSLVEAVAFRIVPAPGSRRAVGDQVYYGDRIVLEAVVSTAAVASPAAVAAPASKEGKDVSPSPSRAAPSVLSASSASASAALICKYDQLGANGYLGPDGSAGAFETTIWKHGSSMFNADRSVVFDKDLVVLEELTLNRAFGKVRSSSSARKKHAGGAKSKAESEAAASAANSGESGGYLMFNGVGDAPVPFALSVVAGNTWGRDTTHDDDAADDEAIAATPQPPSEEEPAKPPPPPPLAILQNLKILEFTLPGVHATVVNDFHNMLLPLLHLRVAMLHADVRGRVEDKFTALASLRVGVQAYNSQLAVWEPVVEDFDVNMAFHGRGGVLCDFCMSERHDVSPSGAALRCDGIPTCLFRASRTDVFADAAAHSWEAKHFIYRELLAQADDDSAKQAHTFLLVIKKDVNVNLSRNVINVLVHSLALVSKAAAASTDDALLQTRLGPFIYVDNQSGIPFLVATHASSAAIVPPPSTAAGTPGSPNPFAAASESGSFDVPTPVPSSSVGASDTPESVIHAETSAFQSAAWSRRRLSTMLNDMSSSRTTWLKVNNGERIATDIVAHETPAGSVTSPLRRLLWLKPQSEVRTLSSSAAAASASSGKAIPVPIGYSNRSYLYLESHNGSQDVWHGESVICETVAEQGTLVLRLRGKVQLKNYLDVPVQVLYNEARVEVVPPGGQTAHYIPIQFLESGTISFCPLLRNGELQRSAPLAIASLLKANPVKPAKRGYHQQRQQIGALELRKALTFYWDAHPTAARSRFVAPGSSGDVDFAGIPLPPFQLVLTATRKSERHETMISLRAPIELENLIPYEISFRTACLKSEDDVSYVEKNPASFPGSHGTIASGHCALIAELELLSDGFSDSGAPVDVPSIVALSLAIPEINLSSYSAWSARRFVYGCQSFCERLELSMGDGDTDAASASRSGHPSNKLTICVEVVQLEKLRSKALNALGPVICRVFTEYWLLDRTSLSLSFYTADGYRIPSNDNLSLVAADDDAPNVSLSVFSSESKQHVSKMKVGIKTNDSDSDSGDTNEVRSDAFDISAVGVRGQILVPTQRSEARTLLSTILERPASAAASASSASSSASSFQQFEFGVTIEQGPGKFSRSKVVTLVARYYFVNTSNRFDIHVRQERSPSADGILVLRPKESKFLHWSDSRLPSRVQLRFVQPGTPPASADAAALSQWSSPFELSSVGNFVLKLKKNLQPAPAHLARCYEAVGTTTTAAAEAAASAAQYDKLDDYLVGDGYWNYDALEAERMLAGGMQLHVAVELHDPSFFVYLEEGAFEEDAPATERDAFVPYRIKNECSDYELVVWQKMVRKDARGPVRVGFEGGEQVLPFHAIDYVPYTFAAVPTVLVQVQKVAGLKRKHKKGLSGRDKATGTHDAAVHHSGRRSIEAVVVATFEAQLNKLHRLPTLEVVDSDSKTRKRLWVEVLLDQATKTLHVTDMLPGVSGEHKRRRRSSLLRSWKRYNSSILSISHAIASRVPTLEPHVATPPKLLPAKKKQVRFAEARSSDEVDNDNDDKRADNDDEEKASESSEGVGTISEAFEATETAQQLNEPLSPAVTPAVAPLSPPSCVVLCVKIVDVMYLEELLKKRGRSDFKSCQPFLSVDLKGDAGASARTKLVPQPAAVFPRWLPSPDSPSLLSLTLSADDASASAAPNALLSIQVRESDKLLFGSSLVASVEVPLTAYLAASRLAASAALFPDVREYLVPIDVPADASNGGDGSASFEESNRAMLKFQLCCQYVRSSASLAAASDAALDALRAALADFAMKRELECLVSSKTRLKVLLEAESVDVTTGRDSLFPTRARGASGAGAVADKSGSQSVPAPPSSAELTASAIEEHARRSLSTRGSTLSVTTDDTQSDFGSEDLSDEKRLTAVLVGVSNLQIPPRLLHESVLKGTSSDYTDPKVYCTITYKEATRSAASSIAKAAPYPATAASSSSDNDDSSKRSSNGTRLEQVRTHVFAKGEPLGLDLVYQSGRVLVQGVTCDGPCGALLFDGKIRIGDTVVAVNGKPIVNLHREASFGVIERALEPDDGDVAAGDKDDSDGTRSLSLSFLYQPVAKRTRASAASSVGGPRKSASQLLRDEARQTTFDAEWNRRVEFTEGVKTEAASDRDRDRVLVQVYLRHGTADHGLSAAQEPSVVPFLYFFGDDRMMDHLDHSKQDSRFDVLLAECWVPLPPSAPESLRAAAADPADPAADVPFYERVCALYSPQLAADRREASAIEMVGQLRLALKWDLVNAAAANQHADELQFYCQLEVARVCLSVVDDASSAAVLAGAAHKPREVLCVSLSDQHASAGVQLSYGRTSNGKHVVNARVGHFQVDNQLLETDYPVMLAPIRLVDYQQLHRGVPDAGARNGDKDNSSASPMLLPTFQLMSVFSAKPTLLQFEYIFGQLQELEIKLEDSLLVALAQAFSGVQWPTNNSDSAERRDKHAHEHAHAAGAGGAETPSNLALHLLAKDWSSRAAVLSRNTSAALSGGGRGANRKVLLRWLLLCPVKVNVTFTSTADRSLLLSLLSPDLYSVLSTLISAAAALVSNLDQAPIKIPEFYVENLLETTHTLAFYAMQHYVHHGLRSWYNIMGSVDFLGNPIGLVSTLGAGVKDFFYTPAQMLLEDEKGLRIANLRTGMTQGSKSLLRNTAVGIFHTTGKITETLGKGIALLAMDEQYNVQRQRQSSKQIKKISDLGDAIAEGGKGLAGGVWDGLKGVVAAPVRGAERDGASGFVFGVGKGFAGLIVKPTAGFLDLLTSLSRGAKTSAEAIDGANNDADAVTRFRLPRRICSDGVLVSYSEREATGNALLLLTALDATDEYVYHVYYGQEPQRGLVLLTDKRVLCLSAMSGQKLWEVALDSTLQVAATGRSVKVSQQGASSHKTYSVECGDDVAATNFRVAVDSARVDLSATRYLLLNLEKSQEEARNGGAGGRAGDLARSEEERSDLHLLMENVQDTMVTGLKPQDLRAQPLRLLSFTVFQLQVYGGPYQWTVFRRFSEFRDLLAGLQDAGVALDALPPLPPRTFLPSTRDSVAKARQDALSMLLQAAIMHSSISRNPLTLEFLTREAQEVRISLPPLSPTAAAGHDASQRGEDSS